MRFLVIALVALASIETALSVKCSIESYNYAPGNAEQFCVLKGLNADGAVRQTNSSITRVAIVDSSLKRLTAAFYERFPRLEHLVVRNSGLEHLHIANTVRIIDASGNLINSVSVQDEGALRELNLHSNPISDISPIGGLIGLTKLNLGDTLIKQDPFTYDLAVLCRLTNLTELIFDGLDIFYLDNTRNCTLQNLRVIDLSHNSFIPWNFRLNLFRTMPQLEVLLLRNCLVSNLIVHPEELRTDFPSLKKIDLVGNRFTCSFLNELLDLLKANGVEAIEPEQSEFCDEKFIHVAKMCCTPLNASSTQPSDMGSGTTTTQLLEELDWTARFQLASRNLKRAMQEHLVHMSKKNLLYSLYKTLTQA